MLNLLQHMDQVPNYLHLLKLKYTFQQVQLDIDMRRLAHNAKKQEAKDKAERENMAEWLATYHNNFGDLDPTNNVMDQRQNPE